MQIAQEILAGEPWLPTPLLQAHTLSHRLGLELWLKREDCTPVGSFKLRGALVTVTRRAHEATEAGVYVASAGNYGLAIAMACQQRGISATVVVPEGATPSKLERIRLCGAAVVEHSDDFDIAKDYARARAAEVGAAFWEDGAVEEMSFGSSTIAAEILERPQNWDAVLVPVGNGSLIRGVASVFKELNPSTTVVGLVSTGSPAMGQAMLGQQWDESATPVTSADGLAVRVPIRPIVEELKPLVDQVWFVDEDLLLPAVRSLMELEQVMVEPSSAITVAGLAQHRDELKGQRVAALLTGAHLRSTILPDVMNAEPLVS